MERVDSAVLGRRLQDEGAYTCSGDTLALRGSGEGEGEGEGSMDRIGCIDIPSVLPSWSLTLDPHVPHPPHEYLPSRFVSTPVICAQDKANPSLKRIISEGVFKRLSSGTLALAHGYLCLRTRGHRGRL